MTSSDIPSRRNGDDKLDELLGRLDTLEAGQKAHVKDYHAFKAPELRVMVAEHKRLMDFVPENRELLEKVIVILDGKPTTDITGVVTGREGGMRSRQALIERDVSSIKHDGNGGRGFSVRTRDKLIIIIANGLIAIGVAWLAIQGTS